MFALEFFTLFVFMSSMVSAYPLRTLVLNARAPAASTTPESTGSQAALSGSSNSTTAFRTLQSLYDGNRRFRSNVRVQEVAAVDEAPSFMFLGCLDSRLTPSTIFNAPAGSIVSHNNIGNQYSSKDSSADAAVAYAIDSLHVQHIIVLGHYGCKGVETAITKSQTASDLVRTWVKPISDLYATSRRAEIVKLRDSRKPQRGKPNGITAAPAADDVGYRALVEENVKRSVNELRGHSMLTKAFARNIKNDKQEPIDVFVHGFVYDEVTNDVHDLNVSFGPPGKPIPNVPFKAIAAAKNIHRDSFRPGINRGKTWDFVHEHPHEI